MDLKDKVIFTTGSSLGIGAAIAKEFSKSGSKIIITYNHSKTEAEKVEKDCQEFGATEDLLIQLDVTNNESIKAAVKEVVEKFGQIDILVNNAGVFEEGIVAEITFEHIEHQVRVNLEGLIKMTHAALPYTKGAIVNIASRAGLVAYHPYYTYGATKWGVRGFSKGLAGEASIPIYIVNPTGTATQMNDFEGDPPEKVAKIVVDVVTGKISAKSGDDINIWEH